MLSLVWQEMGSRDACAAGGEGVANGWREKLGAWKFHCSLASPLKKCYFETVVKLQILSDLHLEMGDYAPVQTDADVVLLGRDVHVGRWMCQFTSELRGLVCKNLHASRIGVGFVYGKPNANTRSGGTTIGGHPAGDGAV